MLLLLHGACYLLVVFYVNMFTFWAWLSRALGPGILAKLLPILVTGVVLLITLQRFIDRVYRGQAINLVFLGLGLVGAIFSLAIPDPAVPIKRIHVAEYLALAFLVRATLSHRLQGARLTLFTALVTLLLGIHDEMLQGLHPDRYYHWRDMIVNAAGGLSGTLLGHGLLCCVRPKITATVPPRRKGIGGLSALFLLLAASTAWLVLYIFQHLGAGFSLLALVPQAAVCLLIIVLYPEVVFSSRTGHGFQALFWLALSLLAYPLVANLAGIEFR